ncbi:hypothetical protein SAMN03159444_03588 [Pseudomonas sp. NFACC02]|nr:hypothetical protein SAMN03159444_03588 [Pseudomonas sp. NFACC02]
MVRISTIWGDADGVVCPNVQTVPPSAGYLITPSNQGSSSWLGPPASGTRTPTTLRGPAPNGHPCPDGALAASMPLGPLRVACVWPAPKSRFVVSGLLRYQNQDQDQDQDQDQKRSAPCAFVGRRINGRSNAKPVGVSLLTNAVCHSPLIVLNHRIRGQARSYSTRVVFMASERHGLCGRRPRLRGYGPHFGRRRCVGHHRWC